MNSLLGKISSKKTQGRKTLGRVNFLSCSSAGDTEVLFKHGHSTVFVSQAKGAKCTVTGHTLLGGNKDPMEKSENKVSKRGGQDEKSDALQTAMGDFGWWQAKVCVLVSLLKIPVAWHQLGIVFLAPPVEHWCDVPGGRNSSDSCYIPGTQEKCQSWIYDRSIFSETIITQWNLVCGRTQLANLAQTTFMLGILFGNVLFGIASDKFGRKLPMMIAIFVQVVAGVATAFVPNLELFMVVRFLQALATGGTMMTSFVICMEVVGGWWRMAIGILYQLPFSAGHIVLSGIAYYARDWRSFQLAITLPSILLLSYWWLVPESPRWLLAVGRHNEAIAILEEAARRNGRDPSLIAQAANELVKKLNKQQEASGIVRKANLLDLFKTPNLRKKTLSVYFNWLVCGLCFYGLAQYMGQLAGNIFTNVAWSGLIEIPGTILCIYFMGRFGRRNTLLVSQLVAGISCLAIMLVPSGIHWPNVMLASFGIVGMSIAFPDVYLFSGELFPTVVRNAGVGSSSMCARIGSMAAPFIAGLGQINEMLPPIMFGTGPVIAAGLCLFLPDTTGYNLPDTLEEGENFGRKKSVSYNSGTANPAFVGSDEQSVL